MKILVALVCLEIVISTVLAQNDTDELYEDFEGDVLDVLSLESNSTESGEYEEEEDDSIVQVNTYLGSILGKRSFDEDGDEIHAFLGIPYAQPPVGELRFQSPKPVHTYDNFEAFDFGSPCPQKDLFFSKNEDLMGNEDCLYLNIYTKASNKSELKPVMFFIHGGGFVIGSAEIYQPFPLIKEDVIVVTINYRLGAFGFLTFGNDVAPGNLGLRDQIQALKWVKQSIQYFGGNPNKITVFGESAGSMSTHALTMSPKAFGLMSGVIYESGTMLMSKEKYDINKPYRVASYLADYFNCSSNYYDYNMLECLQDISAEELLEKTLLSDPAERADSEIAVWFPNIDTYSRDPVLPTDYLTAMKNGYFNRIPIMTGTMLNDGALMYPPELEYGEFWEKGGPLFLFLTKSFNASEITEEDFLVSRIIKKYYTGESNNLLETLPEFANMINDALFLSPDQKVAELASKYVPVFNYRFTFPGTHSYLPFYLAGKEDQFGEETKDAVLSLKPVHADDTIYLFSIFDLRTEEEMQMRETMVKYWTNFAKYGHPSPLISDNLTQWLSYSSDKNYMVLDLEPTMEKQVENERMTFWQKILWNEREAEIEERNIFVTAFHAVLRFFRGY